MTILVVPQTVLGPNQPLGIPVDSSKLGLIDMTAISSPTLQVIRPDGTTTTWAATLVPTPPNLAITKSQATFQYVWQPGDLSTGGLAWRDLWSIAPFAVLGGAPVEFYAVTIRVVDEWGRR